MKKWTSLLCIIVISFSLTACSGTQKEITDTEALETTADTEALETILDEAYQETKEVVMQEAYKVVEADVNQPIQINAKYGSYQITVTGAEEVDWWYRKHQTNVKHVVLIHYDVENLNFSSNFSEGVNLKSDCFRVLGSNGYQGKAFLTYYDGYESMGVVKPGEKKSGVFAYEIDNPKNMPEYYTVVYKNSSGDIAKVQVDLY